MTCPRAAAGALRHVLFWAARTKHGCAAAPARPGAAHGGGHGHPASLAEGGGNGGCGVGRVNAEIFFYPVA